MAAMTLKLLSTIVFVFAALSVRSIAGEADRLDITHEDEITAEVIHINGDVLTAEDTRGKKLFFRAASSETLHGFEIGDVVILTLEMGHTTSIHKIQSAKSAKRHQKSG